MQLWFKGNSGVQGRCCNNLFQGHSNMVPSVSVATVLSKDIVADYMWLQRFRPLKCVYWNLGASHLPEVYWKGREGGKLCCSFHLPSFLHSFSGAHAGFSQQGRRTKAVNPTMAGR
jgi:hypothetical protein